MFDADDASGETDSDGVGQRDVGWKGQRDFEFGAGCNRAVEVEEDAAGAHVLGFGLNLGLTRIRAFDADYGGQAHVEPPHHPPFL